MKKLCQITLLSAIVCLLFMACGDDNPMPVNPVDNMNPPDPVGMETNPNAGIGEVREITSFQLVEEIGPDGISVTPLMSLIETRLLGEIHFPQERL